MKFLLTATLIATTLAWPVRAFDVDEGRDELIDRLGAFTVSDLTVGVTGNISIGGPCHVDGRLFIYNLILKNDRAGPFFEVELQPSGEFALALVSHDYSERPREIVPWYALDFEECLDEQPASAIELFPVATVDGFTTYSAWLDHIFYIYNVEQ